MENEIKVVELFAGVGGFRLGLEGWNEKSASSGYKKPFNSPYKVVWSNQWEPSTKTQHATLVYENRFGKNGHSNEDIAQVDVDKIPDHDLLVGGFPCQDYSVATTLKNSKGLIGKKGVLWWSIHKIITEKKNKPKYLFLENVDYCDVLLTGQAIRSNLFSFLKKGFPLLSLTQNQHKMNIQQVMQELNSSKHQGFQLEKRNGILTSTWLLYKKEGFYFYFDINQKISFADEYKYSENEMLEEFKNSNFKIDLAIN